MNALYQSIARKIAWAFIKHLIDALKKDKKFSLKTLAHPLAKNDKRARTWLFAITNAIREGLNEQEIKEKFLDEYVEIITNALYTLNQRGGVTQGKLREAFDQYRSIPTLRNLSERDFFLFLAYSFTKK